jgi:pimeloyl-ACP methyl ester carboxylesterase
MSHDSRGNARHRLARRSFLRLMAGTTAAVTLVACQPITRPSEPPAADTAEETDTLELQSVIANGVELHYVEHGEGDPLILVHGGLSDYREWGPQMARFAADYRVLAYSQRYYYPNQNLPIVPDYTTLVDAADLAALVQALSLGRSHIVGYSSGAYMALAMALDHPELVHTLVLAEPPIIDWAPALPGGAAVYAAFMDSFWTPVGEAFRHGDKELALRKSVEFFIGADVLDELPPEVRQAMDDNIWGWEAFTTSQDCFPLLDKQRVAALPMPVLLLAAANTLPMHKLINAELARLLPQASHVTIADATHEMWSEQPDACGEAVLQFLQAHA